MKIVRTVAVMVLGVIAALALGTLVVPHAFGWSGYVVTSPSMEPAIGPGSVVVVAPTDPARLAEGDVVTFRNANGALTTHRINAVRDAGTPGLGFVTKGDANEDVDPVEVEPGQVVGQVRLDVPLLGWVVTGVSTPIGLALFAFAVLALVMAPTGSKPDEEQERAERGVPHSAPCGPRLSS